MPSVFMADGDVTAAEQMIRDYCGWHVAPVITETLVLDGTGTHRLLLPSRCVVDVSEVAVNGEPLDPDDYEWSQGGILCRRLAVWPDRYRAIRVTLEHGFAAAPVLAEIAAAVEARAAMDPTGALASQRAGTQSVAFSAAASAAGRGLLASEQALLAPYKLTWGP